MSGAPTLSSLRTNAPASHTHAVSGPVRYSRYWIAWRSARSGRSSWLKETGVVTAVR